MRSPVAHGLRYGIEVSILKSCASGRIGRADRWATRHQCFWFLASRWPRSHAGSGNLHGALARITDSHHRMFVDERLMRDICRATQADRALLALDPADGELLAGLLAEALANVAPSATRTQRGAFAELMMIRIAAAVRHAITLQPKAARQLLAMFKRTLPRNLAVLDA